MRQVSGQESGLNPKVAANCLNCGQKVFKWIRYFTGLIQLRSPEQNEPLIYRPFMRDFASRSCGPTLAYGNLGFMTLAVIHS
jgi:hypothetical protein